ncbi:MAG TPA: hypothetical protein VGR08_01895 [Thermomicrobiales bacterium]|nr:hypothetical protein [Thermomicrobiales bacterium]
MMQRTIGMYIANRIKNEIFAKPEEATADDEDQVPYEDPLDGEQIHDDEGHSLGTAYRLHDVAVYVVAGNRANPDTELERAINDPDSELIIHREGRRITALVYIPEQIEQAPTTRTRGFRADDV